MLHLSDARRYWIYTGDTDMRKSFHGLASIIRDRMGQDMLSGDVYVFISRRRHAIKLLRWEGDGFAIFYKRLEKGTFEMPSTGSQHPTILVTDQELSFILKGIALKKVKYRIRYSQNAVSC